MAVASGKLGICEISIRRLEFFWIVTIQGEEVVQILPGNKNNDNSLSHG
jgi:hypothetical protein